MKYLLKSIPLFLLLSFRQAGGIYDITLTTIDGNKIELSQFKGKKLLFILLPLSSQDASVSAEDIGRLQARYANSLEVIGIPAVEAGYVSQNAGQLLNIYTHANANIIITEGMKVKKGTGQSALLEWLTNKSENRHFNQDVDWVVGSKFFVDETGELYGEMGPQLSLTSPLIDKIIARTLTGK